MKLLPGVRAQRLLDVYLFLNVLAWCGWQGYRLVREGRFGYVDGAFIVQSLVVGFLFLVRKPAAAIDESLRHQAVALAAFLSGVAFLGAPVTSDLLLIDVSRAVTFAANFLGIVTLANLGRSFGVLIAFREVRTGGLYSVVRHPMYGTDILLRVGYLISHFTPFTAILFAVSAACYVWRAVLEERFLSARPEYRAYMEKVRYRMIPYVF